MDRMVDLFHAGTLARLDKWIDAAPDGEHRFPRLSFRRGMVDITLVVVFGGGGDANIGCGYDLDPDLALDLAIDDLASNLADDERLALESASSAERSSTDSERDARGAAE